MHCYPATRNRPYFYLHVLSFYIFAITAGDLGCLLNFLVSLTAFLAVSRIPLSEQNLRLCSKTPKLSTVHISSIPNRIFLSEGAMHSGGGHQAGVCVCVCPTGQASLTLPVALALNPPPCLGPGLWLHPDSGCRVSGLSPHGLCVPFTLHWCTAAWQMRALPVSPYLAPIPPPVCILTPIELRHRWAVNRVSVRAFVQYHSSWR